MTEFYYLKKFIKDSQIEVFEKADVCNFDNQEMKKYEQSLKTYRDLNNILETAVQDGIKQGIELGIKQGIKLGIKQSIEQGIEQGKYEQSCHIARQLKALNTPIDVIVSITGLNHDDINQL